MADSVRWATVLMTSTALKGNFPYALSPDSMTASAPSRTAMAMSDTCARTVPRLSTADRLPSGPVSRVSC